MKAIKKGVTVSPAEKTRQKEENYLLSLYFLLLFFSKFHPINSQYYIYIYSALLCYKLIWNATVNPPVILQYNSPFKYFARVLLLHKKRR